MVDIFEKEQIQSKDIFSEQGITPPSVTEQNVSAFGNVFTVGASEAIDETTVDISKEALHQREQFEKLAASRFTPEQLKKFEEEPIGAVEAFNNLELTDGIPFVGAAKKAYDIIDINSIAEKYKAGEQLTTEEEEKFSGYVDNVVEQRIRGYSWRGGLVHYGFEMPAFMVEFAATGGVGKSAQTAAMKITGKAVERAAIQKAAGLAANVATRTAAIPSLYVPAYAERRLNDFMAVTDKGGVIFKESTETPASSAAKAFLYTTAEVASELSGAAIGKYVTDPVLGKLKTPLIYGVNKLPNEVKMALYKAYKKIQPNAQVSKVFTRAGYHGLINELGEEQVNRIMSASIGAAVEADYTMEQFIDEIVPSKDQLMLEAGLISIAGGVKTSASVLMNRYQRKGKTLAEAKEMVANTSAIEQESLVDGELQFPESGYTVDVVGVDDAREFKTGEKITVQSFHGKARGAEITTEATGKLAGTGAFFSNRKMVADSYAPQDGEVVEHTLTFKNPYVVDAKGAFWNKIDLDGQIVKTDDIARAAREQGYDGVIIQNVIDRGANFKGAIPESEAIGNVYVAFDKESISTIDILEFDRTLKAANQFNNGLVEAQINAAEKLDPPPINDEESNFNKFHRDWVNSLQPIEDLSVKALDLGIDIPRGEDPKLLARTYAGAMGMARQNLQVETFVLNKKGEIEKTGKALKPIMDDWDNSVAHIEPNRKKREADFNDYMVARRTIEDLQDRPDVEITEEQKLKAAEDMARLGLKYGDDFGFFDEFSQEVYDFQRRILRNLVESGIMSQETFDEIVKQNPHYIPFQRVMDDKGFENFVSAKGVFTDAKASAVVKKIKGSQRDIKNVFHSVIANTAKIVDLSYRNRVAQSIANFENFLPEYVQKVPTPMKKVVVTDPETGKEIETFRPTGVAPRDAMTVMVDGKAQFFKVSKPLLEAINQLQPVKLGFLEKLFTLPATVLRAGATLNPEFWARNVLRDQQTGLIQSEVRPTPIDMVRGLFAVMGKTDLYNEWMQSGGSFNSYMELSDTGIENSYKELFRPDGKLIRYLKNPINIPADISGGLEQATRVGIFGKARRLGKLDIEAAFEAREGTLDFARGGVKSKVVNRIIPFFNVGIQGTDKLARIFKNNPKATTFWGVATITMPSVLITGYYLYDAPEEERQEYLEIPQWQKDMFWVFKVDGEWKRYPKPFSLGYLFGSLPERMMHWGYDGEKPEMEHMYRDAIMGMFGAVTPVYDASALIPPAFKVVLEDITNYNFFTGRSIYPEWMEKLEPEHRMTKYTTETSKFIGEQLGVSPAKVDNTIRGTIAGSAPYVTDAGDFILNSVKKWNGEKLAEKPMTASDVPLIKAFSIRRPSGYRAISTQNFFKDFDEIQQKHATLGRLEGKEKAEYRQANKIFIQSYKPMKAFNAQMRTFGKQMDQIYDDEKMSSKEKVKRIGQLEDKILAVAKKANKWYKDRKGEK